MIKTLTLMALLGTLATTSLSAKEVWWKGVTHDPETKMMDGAITTYKYNPYAGGADSDMCWVASACNVIAWWQDRVEENGALIIPEGTPRDYEIYDVERTLWKNVGGYQGNAIQMWMTGGSKLDLSQFDATQAGLNFAGYYPRLAGAGLGIYNYSNTKGVNPETAAQFPNDYSHYEYTMIQTQWYKPSSKSYSNPDLDNYERASKQIVDYMENEWGVVWSTTIHAMTVYGVELDEDGLITTLYNSDNNVNIGYEMYKGLSVWSEDNGDGSVKVKTGWSGYQIDDIVAVRTTGIRFLDYDVRVGKNLVEDNEFLFSHYCNLIVDGDEDYKLRYDLRDASVEGSPVDAKKVEPYIVDEGYGFTSYHERYTDEVVTTGDLLLRGGKVTLVNCAEDRVKLDGGGKVAGVIRFQDSVVKGTTDTIQEADRTLKVDRTDTIAKEINLSATKGTNTLEVTEGNKATFGTLSGTGDLDKTGAGTAEVTDAVTLNGEIRVKEGDFIFGKNVELTDKTVLTVSNGAHVQGKAGKSLTLSITSGVHVNDGEMTLTTTMTGGVLKGSGTFADVTMDGGTLIVGNSPGRQTYTEALTVNMGDIIFSVDGWNTAANGEKFGWGSGTYSNIVMGEGGALTLNEGAIVNFAVGGDALANLLGGEGGFSMDIATGIGNTDVFTSAFLQHLALQTKFYVATEDGADTANNAGLNAGADLTARIYNLAYSFKDGGVLSLSGSFEQQVVPEPATGTLSLLALAALAARRRRK